MRVHSVREDVAKGRRQETRRSWVSPGGSPGLPSGNQRVVSEKERTLAATYSLPALQSPRATPSRPLSAIARPVTPLAVEDMSPIRSPANRRPRTATTRPAGMLAYDEHGLGIVLSPEAKGASGTLYVAGPRGLVSFNSSQAALDRGREEARVREERGRLRRLADEKALMRQLAEEEEDEARRLAEEEEARRQQSKEGPQPSPSPHPSIPTLPRTLRLPSLSQPRREAVRRRSRSLST